MRTSGVAMAAALLLIAGCGGAEAPPSERKDAGRSTEKTTSARAAADRDEPDRTNRTEEDLPSVTGTHTITKGDPPKTARLDLRGLHRDGKLTRLDFTLTNIGSEQLFAGDHFSLVIMDQMYLLDTDGLKKYMLVQDSENKWLFNSPSVYLDEGEVVQGTAYFPALPEDMDEIELVIEEFGRFRTPIE